MQAAINLVQIQECFPPKCAITMADQHFLSTISRPLACTDEGLWEVAKLQQLSFLSLDRTKVTAEDVVELKKALPKYRIRHNAKK